MATSSLKEYLKRYESKSEKEDNKKKKKNKKKAKPESSGVLVVDEDPVWQKQINLEEEEEEEEIDSADEAKPLVEEDIEVKRMRRLEVIRGRRGYDEIAEDGSGWVSVSLSPKHASDMSPPRKRNDTPSPVTEDTSPPRKRRASPDPKVSPSTRDISPPRKRRGSDKGNADISPPSRGRPSPFPKLDLSPPRKMREDSGTPLGQDISPPRKKKIDSSLALSFKERPKTGLISGRDISHDISKIRKDDLLRFEQMDPSISGRGAEPVYRDKKGERISKEEYMKSKQKVEEKPKEIKIEWGKGLAQKREAEAKIQELELEKDKPFARNRGDPELDKMLKDRLRWGDPMAHLVKKKHSEVVLPNFGDNEKMKESGFIIPQDIPNHSWIKRGLEAAPNRYGIKPGRHWDGVDRSNGYEKQLFKRLNEKQATEKEAYLWSVSEM